MPLPVYSWTSRSAATSRGGLARDESLWQMLRRRRHAHVRQGVIGVGDRRMAKSETVMAQPR